MTKAEYAETRAAFEGAAAEYRRLAALPATNQARGGASSGALLAMADRMAEA